MKATRPKFKSVLASLLTFTVALILSIPDAGEPTHGTLELRQVSARAYEVVGPEKFMKSISEEVPPSHNGCGISIDWGDGSHDKNYIENCAELLTHAYSVPGQYSLTASIWHPGPNGPQIKVWNAKKEIVVSPRSEPETVSLKLVEFPNPADVIFAQDQFWVGVAIEIDQPSMIKMTLRDLSGQQISMSDWLTIETSADGRYDIGTSQYLESAYKQIASGGELPFQATIDLIQNDRVLRSIKTRWYRLSAEYDPSYWGKTWKIRPLTQRALLGTGYKDQTSPEDYAPLEVARPFEFYVEIKSHNVFPCYRIRVDWGDGTDAVYTIGDPDRTSDECEINVENQRYVVLGPHTYESSGTYDVKIYGISVTSKSIDEIYTYRKRQIVVDSSN
ncbi:MAG: hypothetical protein AAFN16_02420 [Pseudomonadota bacterium]